MASATFPIVISAVDNASKNIDAINRKLAEMRAPADRLHGSLTKLAQNTGMTDLGNGMRNLAHYSTSAFESMGRIVPALGAITAAASVAGIARLADQWANAGTQLKNAGERAGLGAGKLAEFQGAARLAGSSAEAMTSGMKALGDNITEAAAGRSVEASNAFSQLGVSLKGANGQVRKNVEMFPELIEKIRAYKDPTMRMALATRTLGGAAEELWPIIEAGAKAFEKGREQARKHGAQTTQAAIAADELRRKQEGLKLSVEGLGNSIAGSLSPAMGPMLDDLSRWIDANREIMAGNVTEFFKQAVPAIKEYAGEINKVVQNLGGWKVVAEGLVAVWAAGKLAAIAVGLRAIVAVLANPIALAAIAAWMAYYKATENFKVPTTKDEYNDRMRALPADSPLWQGIPAEDQSNYVNSPRSQEFLRGTGYYGGNNPNPYSRWNPGSWLGRTDGQGPLSGLQNTPVADTSMNPTRRAFLDKIAGPESGGDYTVKNGGAHFSSFAAFPEGVAPGGTSTAAGRYQFTSGTWRSLQNKLGLSDFSPVNQDKAAWHLAAERYRATTARDLEADLQAGGNESRISSALSPTWPSMMRGPSAQIANGSGTSAGAQETTVRGSANVNIKLDGFPAGTRTTSTTEGDLFSGAPTIAHSMPGFGP